MNLLPMLILLSPWVGFIPAHQIRDNGVVTVPEGDNALLPCSLSSRQNIDKFDWRKDNGEDEKKEVFFYDKGLYYGYKLQGQSEQFKDRVVFFQHELKSGNASIIIKNTRLEDNGTYTCVLFESHREEVSIRLNVGAAPMPYIIQVPVDNTRTSLECKAHGVPKPKVDWRNSAGEGFPAEHTYPSEQKDASGRFQVYLQVNVTRSDTYTCVVTQREIFHQINRTVKVHFQDVVAVSEGADAVLPCSLDSKITESLLFSWRKEDEEVLLYNRGQVKKVEQFIGRLGLFQQELKYGNASIKIHNVQKSDDGYYTCHLQDIQKSHVILQVVEYSTGLIVTVVVVIVLILFLVFGIIIAVLSRRIHSLKEPTSRPSESDSLDHREL